MKESDSYAKHLAESIFEDGARSACGRDVPTWRVTGDWLKVTCPNCERTALYKAAAPGVSR